MQVLQEFSIDYYANVAIKIGAYGWKRQSMSSSSRQSGSCRLKHPELWVAEGKSLVPKAVDAPQVTNPLDCKASPSP